MDNFQAQFQTVTLGTPAQSNYKINSNTFGYMVIPSRKWRITVLVMADLFSNSCPFLYHSGQKWVCSNKKIKKEQYGLVSLLLWPQYTVYKIARCHATKWQQKNEREREKKSVVQYMPFRDRHHIKICSPSICTKGRKLMKPNFIFNLQLQ